MSRGPLPRTVKLENSPVETTPGRMSSARNTSPALPGLRRISSRSSSTVFGVARGSPLSRAPRQPLRPTPHRSRAPARIRRQPLCEARPVHPPARLSGALLFHLDRIHTFRHVIERKLSGGIGFNRAVNALIAHEVYSRRRYCPSSHRIHDASANGARRLLLRLGMRRKETDTYTRAASGKNRCGMDRFLERLIVVGSQASNRVCRETCGRRGSSQPNTPSAWFDPKRCHQAWTISFLRKR